MRNVVLYQLLSFDGVAEEPSDWMFDAGQEVVDNLARIIGPQDDVLFGRGRTQRRCRHLRSSTWQN